MAGVSSLFTRDFFLLGKARLRPGGLFCQWAHVYNMAPQDLRTIVGSFTDAFPEAALLAINEADVLLVGGRDALPALSPGELAARLAVPRVRADLAQVGVTGPAVFASLISLAGGPLAEWAAGAPRHTDDRPILELRASRSLWADTSGENQRRIREAAARGELPEPFASLRAALTPAERAARGALLEKAHSFGWAFEAYRDALLEDPGLLAAHEGLVRCAVKSGRLVEAAAALDPLAGRPGLAAARIGRALLAHNQHQPAEALRLLGQALALDPGSTRALLLAAEVQEQAGDHEAVEVLARRALAVDPGNADAEAMRAAARLARGDREGALALGRAILARAPATRRALEVAAVASAEAGRAAEARSYFRALVELEPEGWGYLTNFGIFELRSGDAPAAASLFERAAEVNPDHLAAWIGLRDAARAAGQEARLVRAERVLRSRAIP
jgi:spermidine synthase